MATENTVDAEADLDPAALASLLAFWSDAGVDATYAEAPVDRLAERRPRPTAVAPQPTAPPSMEREAGDGGLDARVRAAREAAAAADDLAALEAAALAFFGAPEAARPEIARQGAARRPVLFGRGPADGTLMVVGEAPDPDDEAQGRVFSGPAGRLLERMLAAAALGERAWLSNIVLQRPATGAAPTPGELAVGMPFLQRAAELLAPRAVLLLGDGPVRSLLREAGGVMTLRGRWFEWGGAPALATFAPGFLLRQPIAKRRAWEDVLTLALRMDHTPPSP